ncbi:MAG: efflux RND transporter permease subunit [Gammaproteobacteria bacterium]|nr:MAG: efflux RND transporter permease subunit [Gammaproteobacteria bacterium]
MIGSRRIALITWFADNPVAANMLVLALLLGGIIGFQAMRQEITPDFSIPGVRITMAYPGATPEEVEQGLVLAIERALRGIDDITDISSVAAEGSATVTGALREDAEPTVVLQEVRDAISRITSFPQEAEPAKISLRRHGFYVISIGVAANLAREERQALGNAVRRRLEALPDVSRVEVRGGATPEIHLEVPSRALREYELTLSEIARRLRQASRDLPGGRLEATAGEILLRTQGRRERGRAFADIPVLQDAAGGRVDLGDIARIEDGFAENRQLFEFNGRPGLRLDVYQVDQGHPIALARRVRALVDELNAQLPDEIEVSVQNDRSQRYAERRAVLLKNGALGLLLVILALSLFLEARLAFWVAFSIPVVFIGSFAFLPLFDVTLNMISLFAFILAVGIVVDDAIIVGENIHARHQAGLPIPKAVGIGASEMALPVLFAVGTNILAFLPLMGVPGAVGQFMRHLPIVAIVVFAVSLVEALLVLPAHLRSSRSRPIGPGRSPWLNAVQRLHTATAQALDRWRDGPFRRLVSSVLAHRYLTLLLFCAGLSLVIAWYASGRIDLTWRPEIPGDRVDAELDMPVDASLQQTLAAVRKVERAGLQAIEALGGRRYLASWFTRTGSRRPTFGEISMILVPDDQRPFTQEDFTREWRRQLGDMPEAKSLFFEYLVGPGGNRALRIDLSHPDRHVLNEAARHLAELMATIDGVVDVTDGTAEGKRQLVITPTPRGRLLGLDERTLGSQLRDAYYGAEVRRLLRDGEEIKVLVRLPAEERASLAALAELPIRLDDGTRVPLSEVADIHWGRAFAAIDRENGRRILRVSASIDKAHANGRQIRALLQESVLPRLSARYPDLEWSFSGGRRDRQSTFDYIFHGLMWTALAMFGLFAVLFRSYAQAAVVMATIPFALAGAVAGHVLLGYDLSSVSIYGMIALGGLVVNGSLVLTVRLNELRELQDTEAILRATLSRFRPILLTALTTSVGLAPLLFETSIQARFLVPMAIALTFGTVASVFVVLLLIPALHAVLEDLKRRWPAAHHHPS